MQVGLCRRHCYPSDCFSGTTVPEKHVFSPSLSLCSHTLPLSRSCPVELWQIRLLLWANTGCLKRSQIKGIWAWGLWRWLVHRKHDLALPPGSQTRHTDTCSQSHSRIGNVYMSVCKFGSVYVCACMCVCVCFKSMGSLYVLIYKEWGRIKWGWALRVGQASSFRGQHFLLCSQWRKRNTLFALACCMWFTIIIVALLKKLLNHALKPILHVSFPSIFSYLLLLLFSLFSLWISCFNVFLSPFPFPPLFIVCLPYAALFVESACRCV